MISFDKQTIRAKSRQEITSLSKSYRQKADGQIQSKLIFLRVFKNATSICSYVSTNNEVDTHQIIRETLLAKGSIIVPKIQGAALELYSIRSFEELKMGSFGIVEPQTKRAHTPIQSVDLFIVPGIAFGRDGSRIGRGKGYYDRLLQTIHVPIVALAYDCQVFDTIPHGAKDKKVDIIITETHIYDLMNSSISSV